MDSMVLLEVLACLRAHLDFELEAMHVHHGVNPRADDWVQLCRQVCDARAVTLQVERIHVERAGGESWEEQARVLRYECFTRASADVIALAHHLDDQCETFFLRLLRGSGVRGLSAMAAERALHFSSNTRVLRPLLAVPRHELLSFAQARELVWIEDDSNADSAFPRNFLRHEILPRIESRFPAYRDAIARAVANLQDEDKRASTQTEEDFAEVCNGNRLHLSMLRSMGSARAVAVLRAFLAKRQHRAPARARIEELLRQSLDAKPDADVLVAFDGGSFRRYRDTLYWVGEATFSDPEFLLPWSGEDQLHLPFELGYLKFQTVRGQGIQPSMYHGRHCEVRSRQGGDRLRLSPRRPRRSLKNLMQESEIPPWERARIPILCVDGKPVWIGGLGYDCDAVVRGDELGLCIQWISA